MWIILKVLKCGGVMPYLCDPDFCMEFISIEEAKKKIDECHINDKILCVNTDTHEIKELKFRIVINNNIDKDR